MSAIAQRRPSFASRFLAFAFGAASLALLASAPTIARADGELTRVFYPSQESASFTVDIPSAWQMKSQGEAGAEEYFEVAGPNGVELSFRTIPEGDVDAAIQRHIAYLQENFAEVEVGKPAPATLGGMEGMLLPASGKDAGGSVRDLGAGWFKISDSEAGELFYNVGKSDGAGGAAAVAVLQSIKKGG
jgi:hypothetical protein